MSESKKFRFWHSQIHFSYLKHPRHFFRLKSNTISVSWFPCSTFIRLLQILKLFSSLLLLWKSSNFAKIPTFCRILITKPNKWKFKNWLKCGIFQSQNCRIVRGFAPHISTRLNFEQFVFPTMLKFSRFLVLLSISDKMLEI